MAARESTKLSRPDAALEPQPLADESERPPGEAEGLLPLRPTQRQAAEYVAHMTESLRGLAWQEGLGFLAYLLSLAFEESHRMAQAHDPAAQSDEDKPEEEAAAKG